MKLSNQSPKAGPKEEIHLKSGGLTTIYPKRHTELGIGGGKVACALPGLVDTIIKTEGKRLKSEPVKTRKNT